MPQTLARPEYRLADNLAASDGVVFLTGTPVSYTHLTLPTN